MQLTPLRVLHVAALSLLFGATSMAQTELETEPSPHAGYSSVEFDLTSDCGDISEVWVKTGDVWEKQTIGPAGDVCIGGENTTSPDVKTNSGTWPEGTQVKIVCDPPSGTPGVNEPSGWGNENCTFPPV